MLLLLQFEDSHSQGIESLPEALWDSMNKTKFQFGKPRDNSNGDIKPEVLLVSPSLFSLRPSAWHRQSTQLFISVSFGAAR